MRYAFIIAMLALVGCAQTGLSPEGEQAHYEAQMAVAKQPTLEIECPDGCKFGSLEYHDPRDSTVAQPKVRTPGKDLAAMAVDAALGIAPWVAVESIATEGIEAAQGVTTENSHNRTTRGSNNDTRRDTFGEGAVAGDRVNDESVTNEGRIESPSRDESVTNDGRIESPSDSSNGGRIDSDNDSSVTRPASE